MTPLHRRHRPEGLILLGFWGVGEMSLLMKKEGSGVSVMLKRAECRDREMVTGVCERQVCVDHRNT